MGRHWPLVGPLTVPGTQVKLDAQKPHVLLDPDPLTHELQSSM
jgi:hypothetical protein